LNGKKTKTLLNPDGDLERHTVYKDYSKYLKIAIKSAKSRYYTEKFEKNSQSSKKTWQIINELRGKNTSHMKDDFIIDGNRVIYIYVGEQLQTNSIVISHL